MGAGKSELLSYIGKNYNCRIILADQVAHQVKEPGTKCYDALVELLSTQILDQDGTIHKGKMAEQIFYSQELLKAVNQIIHPAVKEAILTIIQEEKEKQRLDFLFIEAALLIEEGYDSILDEIWYIYASKEVRRKRLQESRQYTQEKISAIMEKQLSDELFRQNAKIIIDNSDSLEKAYQQIDDKLGEYL